MTCYRAEAKERGTVESGVMTLRVHVPSPPRAFGVRNKPVRQDGTQKACRDS